MQAPAKTILALASFRACATLATMLGVVLVALPLLGTHGVESALLLGVLVPPMAGVLAARVIVAARNGRLTYRGPAELLGQIAIGALLCWALPTCVLALNALRLRACDPWGGLLFMLFGPGAGTLLAAVVGALCASLSDRAWVATALAVAPPLMGLVLWGVEFYMTPAVFAFGHFFGYFPGSFYDRLVPLPRALIDLRLVSLAVGLGSLWLMLAQLDARRLRLSLSTRSVGLGLAGIAALTTGLTATALGDRIGFRSTHDRIAERLGGHLKSVHCDLYLPREMQQKARFGHDCDVRVAQAERFLGVRLEDPLRVYVFRSANEKRLYMGAANTNIAKPWRKEIYLQEDKWPHPVLAHEVAHVVAGQVGSGPFRISGSLAGLWPNPGLIEGMAVAIDFHPSSGLTPHQWARATLDLDRIPPLEQLLGPGFFRHQARLSYTLTGSFLRFIYEEHGNEALRRVYTTGDVELAVGSPLSVLEEAWRTRLYSVELSNEGLELARLRFSGTSIFSAVCPHRIAELERDLGQDLAAGDDAAARATCEAILETDPTQTNTRTRYIGVLSRLGETDAAQAQLKMLQQAQPDSPAVLAHAEHVLADEAFRAGDYDAARRAYQALLQMPQAPDMRRLVQVKAFSLDGTRREARLIFEFLIGDEQDATDGATSVHLLRELRAFRRDGLPHYLEGRQLFFRSRFERALKLFAEARNRGLPTEELSLEALRIHAVTAYASGDRVTAKHLFQQLADGGPPALQWRANDWLSRMEIRATLD